MSNFLHEISLNNDTYQYYTTRLCNLSMFVGGLHKGYRENFLGEAPTKSVCKVEYMKKCFSKSSHVLS